MAYDTGWVSGDIDWPNWMDTEKAKGFFANPATISTATAEQLQLLLAAINRRGRNGIAVIRCREQRGFRQDRTGASALQDDRAAVAMVPDQVSGARLDHEHEFYPVITVKQIMALIKRAFGLAQIPKMIKHDFYHVTIQPRVAS